MVPDMSHRAWRELLTGEKQVVTSKLGFNLLLTTKRIYWQKDQSEINFALLIESLHEYLAKYEGLYQEELQQIFGKDYVALYQQLS
jgi:hypothetical protein